MAEQTSTLRLFPPRPRLVAVLVAAVAGIAIIGGAWLLWHDAAGRAERVASALTHGDPARAPALIRRYGCGGCHSIPGLSWADGKVAAPLGDLRARVFIGGVLRNTPDNLVQWIVSPQRFSPRTAMPTTGITEDEARDVAAYLYAH